MVSLRDKNSMWLKYVLIFAAADVVSVLAALAAHIMSDYSFEIFAIFLSAPLVVAFGWWAFREGWAAAGGLKSLLVVPFRTIVTLAILLLFALPTPVREFHSSAMLYGNTAVFLLSVFSRDLVAVLQVRRWILSLLLTWALAAGVDLMARAILTPIWIDFPNGVSLGYNLFFLFSPSAIVIALALFGPSLPRPRHTFFLLIGIGTLGGYCLSVPLIFGVLHLMNNSVASFAVAQATRAALTSGAGGLVAALVLERKGASFRCSECKQTHQFDRSNTRLEYIRKPIEESQEEITQELEGILALAAQLRNLPTNGDDYAGITRDIYNVKLPNIYKRGKEARLFAIQYIVNHFDEKSVQLYDRDSFVIFLLEGKEVVDLSSNSVSRGDPIFENGMSLLAESMGDKSIGCLLSKSVLDAFFTNLPIR